jgi:hypothetical protein
MRLPPLASTLPTAAALFALLGVATRSHAEEVAPASPLPPLPALPPSAADVAPAAARPLEGSDASGDRLRAAQRWGVVDHGVALALRTAAFRLQYNVGAGFQRDVLYGEVRHSCALTSCETTESRATLMSWEDLKLASTTLAFAAVGVGATWLVAAPSERYGVSSLEIKLTTGGTTGLTLIGRF